MFTFPITMMSSADGSYTITHALMLDGSNDYLTFDPSGASSTPDLYCISYWAKRSALGGTNVNVISGGSSGYEDILRYKTDALEFTINGGPGGELQTNAVFRDPTAWHHVFVKYDSANGTAGNRMQMFVNGAEITSFATDSNPSSGLDSNLLDGAIIAIGAYPDGSQNFNGYLAEFIVLDGQDKTVTDFGEYDDNGIWRPIDPSGLTFGTNGFHLDFKSADIGNDAAGSNNFTATSMGANNVVVDTCTDDSSANVTIYPCLDPNNAINQGSAATYSNNNLTASGNSAHTTLKTNTLTDGASKYVWEVTVTKHDTNIKIGAILPSDIVSGGEALATNASTGQGWAFVADPSNGNYSSYRGTNMVTGMSTMADGDMYHVEFNNATGDVYVWRKASGGSWAVENSGATVVNDDGANNGKTALAGAVVHLAGHLYQTSGTNLMTFNFSGPFDKTASSGYNPFTQTITGVGNYCTLNPLATVASNMTFANGNLTVNAGTPGNDDGGLCTIAVDPEDSDGWYFEWKLDTSDNGRHMGFCTLDQDVDLLGRTNRSGQYGLYSQSSGSQWATVINGTQAATGVSYGTGSVMFALKNGKLYMGYNGSWLGSANPATESNPQVTGLSGLMAPYFGFNSGTGSNTITANFGQSDFAHTPPTGYKAINTSNLAATITDPQANFSTLLYKGNGASTYNVIDGGNDGDGTDITGQLKDKGGTGSRWTPDFVWIKNRTGVGASAHMYDSVRGVNAYIKSTTDSAENSSRTDMLKAFDSGGFTLGADANEEAINKDNDTYVAWCWKVGGAPSADNSGGQTPTNNSVMIDGVASTASISTPGSGTNIYPKRASINNTTKFAIIRHTNQSGDYAVCHGASFTPTFLMQKGLGSQGWLVWTDKLGGNNKYLSLSSTGPTQDPSADPFHDDAPTVQTFSNSGTDWYGNASDDLVTYLFDRVPGYCAHGSYLGNNSTSGAYVIVDDGGSGFRPAWVMVKRVDDGYAWHIHNSAMSTHNPVAEGLNANDTGTEATTTFCDFTANGFKLRTDGGGYNDPATYIYLAFAESPFALNNRAR